MNTTQNVKRPIVLSGVKPTGIPTLGNYLGALKNFAKLQNEMTEYDFYIFVADLHAITVPQESTGVKVPSADNSGLSEPKSCISVDASAVAVTFEEPISAG